MKLLAKKITLFFVKKKEINEEDIDVYIYCFEILLSELLNFLILTVLAIVLKMYYQTLIFAIMFIFSRKCMGGYHAKTHLGCMSILIISYTFFVLMLYFVDEDILKFVALVTSVICFVPAIIFAPVINENNPLSVNRRRKNKLFSVLFCVCVFIFNVVYVTFSLPYNLSFCVSYPIFCTVCAVIVAVIQKKEMHFRS